MSYFGSLATSTRMQWSAGRLYSLTLSSSLDDGWGSEVALPWTQSHQAKQRSGQILHDSCMPPDSPTTHTLKNPLACMLLPGTCAQALWCHHPTLPNSHPHAAPLIHTPRSYSTRLCTLPRSHQTSMQRTSDSPRSSPTGALPQASPPADPHRRHLIHAGSADVRAALPDPPPGSPLWTSAAP